MARPCPKKDLALLVVPTQHAACKQSLAVWRARLHLQAMALGYCMVLLLGSQLAAQIVPIPPWRVVSVHPAGQPSLLVRGRKGLQSGGRKGLQHKK